MPGRFWLLSKMSWNGSSSSRGLSQVRARKGAARGQLRGHKLKDPLEPKPYARGFHKPDCQTSAVTDKMLVAK